MKFSDIIGQEELKRHLVDSIESGRVSHAQLFSGQSGAGALPLALAYAQYLNCTHRHDGDACGVCPNCQQIASLAHPDLHLVLPVNKQGKKSGEVVLTDAFLPLFRKLFEQTRGYLSTQQWYDALDLGKTLRGTITAREADEIIRKLAFKSYEAEYKVVLIWLPETMNEEASNKILKILEEPWEKTLFLLVSERPDKLLQTIRSRTQEVSVPRIETSVLEQVAEHLGEHDPIKRHNIARLAGGDYLTLQHLLKDENDEITQEYFSLFCSLMRLSYNDKHLELISWAEDVSRLSREQQRAFLQHAARLLRESYMIHAGLQDISYLWGAEADFCSKFAPFIDNDNVEYLLAEIESAMRQITQNGNPTIVFTHFALSVSKQIRRK
jgi:DNA polymerase-3 subunit delta'